MNRFSTPNRSGLAKLVAVTLFVGTIATGVVLASGAVPATLAASPIGFLAASDGVDVLDPDENFVVEPIAPYAYLVDQEGNITDADGELVIDISEQNPLLEGVEGQGLNPGSTTVVPVFELRYVGNTSSNPANVSVSPSETVGTDVLVFRDASTGQSISDGAFVTMQPADVLVVAVAIDTAAVDPDLIPGIVVEDQFEIVAHEVVETGD